MVALILGQLGGRDGKYTTTAMRNKAQTPVSETKYKIYSYNIIKASDMFIIYTYTVGLKNGLFISM